MSLKYLSKVVPCFMFDNHVGKICEVSNKGCHLEGIRFNMTRSLFSLPWLENRQWKDATLSQKWDASARARVPHAQPPKMLFLYFENYLADRAQIWYAHEDSPAKETAVVKSGVHLHVLTCHVHNPSKSLCSRKPPGRSCWNLVLTQWRTI